MAEVPHLDGPLRGAAEEHGGLEGVPGDGVHGRVVRGEGAQVGGAEARGAEVHQPVLRPHQEQLLVVRLDGEGAHPRPEPGAPQLVVADVGQLLPEVDHHLVLPHQRCLHQGPLAHAAVLRGWGQQSACVCVPSVEMFVTGEEVEVVVQVVCQPPDLPHRVAMLAAAGPGLVGGLQAVVAGGRGGVLEVVHRHVAAGEAGHQHVGVAGVEVEAHHARVRRAAVLGVGGVLQREDTHQAPAPASLAVQVIFVQKYVSFASISLSSIYSYSHVPYPVANRSGYAGFQQRAVTSIPFVFP